LIVEDRRLPGRDLKSFVIEALGADVISEIILDGALTDKILQSGRSAGYARVNTSFACRYCPASVNAFP